MRISLHLIYEDERSRTFDVAKIDDSCLVIIAAHQAILEKTRKANEMANVDAFLGEIQKEEARRFARILLEEITGL